MIRLKHLFFCIICTVFCLDANETSSPRKKALIFGVTGQDGAYLVEFLLNKNYEVHGVKRRSSSLILRESIVFMKRFNMRKTFFALW